MNERQAMACAIYLVGYYVFRELALEFMPVELLVSEKVLEVERIMRELGAGEYALIAACGPWRCTWVGIVGSLLPVALAWGAAGRLFARPAFSARVHPGTRRGAHVAACLVLVPIISYHVVGPLTSAIFGGGGIITYAERWELLTGIAISEHLAYVIVACLAARHSMRIRPYHETGALFSAIEAGDSAGVRREMEAGTDPNEPRASDGATALHIAAGTGQADTIRMVLRYGASPKSRDHTGSTALHVAARTGSAEAVTTLLDAGADPQAPGRKGRTARDEAVEAGHAGAARALEPMSQGALPRSTTTPPVR